MRQSSIDLASLFENAARNLENNRQTINQADAYNGNHGTNMVTTFKTISNALEQKRSSTPRAALNYAARQVARNSTSGSGQIYAQNLARAASHFKGRTVDERGALDLLATLIGGGQPAAAPAQTSSGSIPVQGDEMLGALLGDMGGQSAPAPSQNSGGDLMGSLLGGLAGGQATAPQSSGSGGDMLGALLGGLGGLQGSGSQSGGQGSFDVGDLITAAMAFMQAKQSGGNTAQALVQAFVAGSGMGRAPHREQSTGVVVDSFLQALSRGG